MTAAPVMAWVRPYLLAGVASAIAVCMAWVFLIYGPSQYQAGASAALIKADQATKEAANDLSNAAEGARMRLDLCNNTGGVYSFADGKCKR